MPDGSIIDIAPYHIPVCDKTTQTSRPDQPIQKVHGKKPAVSSSFPQTEPKVILAKYRPSEPDIAISKEDSEEEQMIRLEQVTTRTTINLPVPRRRTSYHYQQRHAPLEQVLV